MEPAEVYEAGAAAARLGVSPSGLRRYAAIYEELHGELPRKVNTKSRLYPAEALERVDEVLSARAAAGLRPPQQPTALLVRAEALRALGRADAASEASAAAHADLMARAGHIDDPELRASFLHAVPEHARIGALFG